MPNKTLSASQNKEITDFLLGYSSNKKLLALSEYEQESFYSNRGADMPAEEPLARARMYAVRHFILDLPNGDEKLFLYYHYIKGHSVMRCADMLGVCERSGFRLKHRALAMAYEHFAQIK